MRNLDYPEEVKQFMIVRMEQTGNNTHIARDIIKKFQLDKEIETVRTYVRYWRGKMKIQAEARPAKRLFFDIETGYYILKIRAWQMRNNQKYFNPDDIVQDKKIICISYKWQHEDKVHTLDWRMGEREMLKAFIKIMGEADECVAHNGDKFDIKEIRTRCIYNGVKMFPYYRTLDTLTKSRKFFRFASNKLDYIGKYLEVGGKKDHRGFDLWKDVVEGDAETSEKALIEMIEYCERDVVLLQDAFHIISPFIDHNNNFAVLSGGDRWQCPECASKNVNFFRSYATPLGVIRREMKCNDCKKQYKVSNKTYMDFLTRLINQK